MSGERNGNDVQSLLMQEDTEHQSSHHSMQKREEEMFLSQLSRDCKERKKEDPNFDQKKYIRDNLFRRFGEIRAKAVLERIYMRLKEKQKKNQVENAAREHANSSSLMHRFQQQPPLQPIHQHQQQHLQSQQAPQHFLSQGQTLTLSNQSVMNSQFPSSYVYPPNPLAFSTNQQPATSQVQPGNTKPSSPRPPKTTATKPKKESAPKRKATDAAGGSTEGAGGKSGPQPPLKKTKKAPASKKETKKQSPSVKGPSAEKAPGGGSSSVDEHGLERVNIDDVLPKGQSSVRESVLPDKDINGETMDMYATMRKDLGAERAYVLSRSADGGTLVSKAKPSVMDKRLLHRLRAGPLFAKVLEPLGMNFTVESLSLLADGVQSHFRTLLESTIAAFHRRTNRKAMEHYAYLEKLMSPARLSESEPGSASASESGEGEGLRPEYQSSFALMFGPNVSEAAAVEYENRQARLDRQLAELEAPVSEQLRQADEAQRKSKKAKGAEKSSVEVLRDEGAPWWKREEALEGRGQLSWRQLALSRFKHKISAKYELGPKARKKPRKDKAGAEEGKEGGTEATAMEVTGGSDEQNHGETDRDRGSASNNPFSAVMAPAQGGVAKYQLAEVDARVALAKLTSQCHFRGGKHCESYGKSLAVSNVSS